MGKIRLTYHPTRDKNQPPAYVDLETVGDALAAAWDVHRMRPWALIEIRKDGTPIYESDSLRRAVERMPNRDAAARIAKEDGY